MSQTSHSDIIQIVNPLSKIPKKIIIPLLEDIFNRMKENSNKLHLIKSKNIIEYTDKVITILYDKADYFRTIEELGKGKKKSKKKKSKKKQKGGSSSRTFHKLSSNEKEKILSKLYREAQSWINTEAYYKGRNIIQRNRESNANFYLVFYIIFTIIIGLFTTNMILCMPTSFVAYTYYHSLQHPESISKEAARIAAIKHNPEFSPVAKYEKSLYTMKGYHIDTPKWNLTRPAPKSE